MWDKLSDRAQARLTIMLFIILFGTGAFVAVLAIGIFISVIIGVGFGLVFLGKYGFYEPYKDKDKIPTAVGIWIYSIVMLYIAFRIYGTWPTDSDTGQFSLFLFFVTMVIVGIILAIPLQILIELVAKPLEGKYGHKRVILECPECGYRMYFRRIGYKVSRFRCRDCKKRSIHTWVDRLGNLTDPPLRYQIKET
ncbi:MAG: hypothetical protein GPJ54_01800 [Candidatus Heimdallarchaeota archaeon]|nr:hypothetical protein [Candidatus Heimdallarchaeota archaeon]